MTSAEICIDFTSVIVWLAQPQSSYAPITESKNAVTSFLSLKCTQSPADYSINLLMNLSSRQSPSPLEGRVGNQALGLEPWELTLQTLEMLLEA